MPGDVMGLSSDSRGVLVACASCGKTNRLRYESLTRQIRCGHCKNLLSPPSAPVTADTSSTFDALISQTTLPVVVDFWAPWCGPCHMMAPTLDDFARRHAGHTLVLKLDTDADQPIAGRFGIRGIPTVIVFDQGKDQHLLFVCHLPDNHGNRFEIGTPGSDKSALTSDEDVNIGLAGGSNDQRLDNAVFSDRTRQLFKLFVVKPLTRLPGIPFNVGCVNVNY